MTAVGGPKRTDTFRLHGDVVLTNTRLHLSLVFVLLATTTAVGAWAVTGSYARTESVVGFITPDGAATKITANRPGIVTRLTVDEGAIVKSGQILAVILVAQESAERSDPTGDDLSEIDKQRAFGQQQIDLSNQSSTDESSKLAATIAQDRSELALLSQQVEHQSRLVRSARDSFEPLATAANDGYVSKLQFEAQRQQYLSAEIQLAQLESQRTQLNGGLHQAEIAKSELPKQTATHISELSANRSSLLQRRIELENSRTYAITAPFAGRIINLQIGKGSAVGAQDTLLSIVDNHAVMHAELYAPSRAVGFAKPGQEVRLLYDAFPYQRFGSFGGRIKSISDTIVAPSDVDPIVKDKIKDPAYRMDVTLDDQAVLALGGRFPLQSGMTLTANIILDRRSLLDWLLDPVNSIRNRT